MRLFRRDPCDDPTFVYLPSQTSEPDYPRFCSVCGSALAYECDKIGFDEKTGAPKFYRWAHCPKWTGGSSKLLYLGYGQCAAFLDATFTERLYHFSSYETFYIDCRPAYECPIPPPTPVKSKRAAK